MLARRCSPLTRPVAAPDRDGMPAHRRNLCASGARVGRHKSHIVVTHACVAAQRLLNRLRPAQFGVHGEGKILSLDAVTLQLLQQASFPHKNDVVLPECFNQIAAQRGILGFGQSSDMINFGPQTQLTAVIDNWVPYYTRRVQDELDGKWMSQDTWGGLASRMVLMAPYTNMPDDAKTLAISLLPGTSGTPAAAAMARARNLSPSASIMSASGPTKTMPCRSHSRGRIDRSDRKP